MKQKLPKLKTKNKDIFLTSSYFANLKKKYQLKNEKLLTEQEIIEDTKNEYEKELEEKKSNIDNQKFLIKMYESNYSIVFDNLKKEYEQSIKPMETKIEKTEPNKMKIPIINLSNIRNEKSGFQQFNQTNYVNQSCMKEYYKKYSKYNNLIRKHPLSNCTPSWAFIKSSNEEKIIPNPLGLLRRFGEQNNLDINNQKVGDTYMKSLSCSLRYYNQHLSKLEFAGNRLTSMGTSDLFKSLNTNKELAYKLRSIDLGENKIGTNNIDELLEFIRDPKCNIEELNFFGNFIGDDSIIKICDRMLF